MRAGPDFLMFHQRGWPLVSVDGRWGGAMVPAKGAKPQVKFGQAFRPGLT